MEKVFKGIRMPKVIIDRVEEYQAQEYISSFTQAVIQLIIKGLESEKN